MNKPSIAAPSWPILWSREGSHGVCSSRFKVLLPASGAQSVRFASSLPASVANTGSKRS